MATVGLYPYWRLMCDERGFFTALIFQRAQVGAAVPATGDAYKTKS